MSNPYRTAAVAKVRLLSAEDVEVRDKLIALCIQNPNVAEGIAEDAEITLNQMIQLLSPAGMSPLLVFQCAPMYFFSYAIAHEIFLCLLSHQPIFICFFHVLQLYFYECVG